MPPVGGKRRVNAAAFLRESDQPRSDSETPEEIEVLECNWPAVQVYCNCQWTVGVGFAGLMWLGISAQEMCAAMFAQRLPRAQWAGTINRVQVMVATARPILNAKPKAAK